MESVTAHLHATAQGNRLELDEDALGEASAQGFEVLDLGRDQRQML